MSKVQLAAATSLLLLSHAALAGDKGRIGSKPEQDRPEAYRELVACREIQDSTTRLACFDRRVAALEQAASKHEIVIADKQAVEAAKRGLFGFVTPAAKLMGFGGNADSADELREIVTQVSGARRSSSGWVLDLEDGSTWEQNDTRDFVLSPKVGNEAKITRGILGTFTISVRGQRPIKMRRVK